MSSVAKQIAEDVATAAGVSLSKLGLRFDRVATDVLGHLTSMAESALPAGKTVILTISAPIRRPAKTTGAIVREISTVLSNGIGGELSASLNGNDVRLRLVQASSRRDHKLIGFVHNASEDPARLLKLAEEWLQSAG